MGKTRDRRGYVTPTEAESRAAGDMQRRLAPWIDSTPLAYAAYVDRALGKRIVDSAWLSDEAARVPQWIAQGRHVYVVDQVYGDVPGYRLVRIPGSPDVYRIEKK